MKEKELQRQKLEEKMKNIKKKRKQRSPDVPLLDENTSMVNRLCHPRLENQGLQAALQEILHSQGQDIIEFVLALFKKTISKHPPEESLPFKDTP